jgi:radical SAM protein with 4Fe4S-binding SPASM domain
VSSWFKKNKLEIELIDKVLKEAKELGFNDTICLSHYNEPLADERICDIASSTKNYEFRRVILCTNADFLTEDIASKLDGVLDDIGVSLYMNAEHAEKRADWIRSLFKKTKLTIASFQGAKNTKHAVPMITHYSPLADVVALSNKYIKNPCAQPTRRLIINHKGDMLLCCDDLVGNFDLGNIHLSSVSNLWYSEKHVQIVQDLLKGNRQKYAHCASCPRKD